MPTPGAAAPATGSANSRSAGITSRGEYDSYICRCVKARRPRWQRAPGGLTQQPGQIFIEHGKHDLRFGITKPHVELDNLGAVRRQHQADV